MESKFLYALKICVCCCTLDIFTLRLPSYVTEFAEQPYKFYKRCFLLKTDWNSKIVHLNMGRKIALCSSTLSVTFLCIRLKSAVFWKLPRNTCDYIYVFISIYDIKLWSLIKSIDTNYELSLGLAWILKWIFK